MKLYAIFFTLFCCYQSVYSQTEIIYHLGEDKDFILYQYSKIAESDSNVKLSTAFKEDSLHIRLSSINEVSDSLIYNVTMGFDSLWVNPTCNYLRVNTHNSFQDTILFYSILHETLEKKWARLEALHFITLAGNAKVKGTNNEKLIEYFEIEKKINGIELSAKQKPKTSWEKYQDSVKKKNEIFYIYGAGCGIAGVHPMLRLIMENLTQHKYLPILDYWLLSPIPELRAYAVEAFFILHQNGLTICEGHLRIIESIKKSRKKINTCYGCSYTHIKLSEALRQFDFND